MRHVSTTPLTSVHRFGDRLVLGFARDDVFLFDVDTRYTHMRLNIGGARRPFDISVCDDTALFVYADAKRGCAVQRHAVTLLPHRGNMSPGHALQVRGVTLTRTESGATLLATCSEDAAVHVRLVTGTNDRTGDRTGDRTEHVLRLEQPSHVRLPLRCLCAHVVSAGQVRLVAGGAKESVHVFDVCVIDGAEGLRGTWRASRHVRQQERRGKWWLHTQQLMQQRKQHVDLRVTAVAAVACDRESLVVAGNSAGVLRLLRSDAAALHARATRSDDNVQLAGMRELTHWEQHTSPILACDVVRLGENLLVITGATDGCVVLSLVSNFKCSDGQDGINQDGINQDGINQDGASQDGASQEGATGVTVRRVARVQLHQSGVNCLRVRHCDDGTLVLATGGDDQRLCVARVRFSCHTDTRRVTTEWRLVTHALAHGSSLVGVDVVADPDPSVLSVFTGSTDQRVTHWRVSLARHARDFSVTVRADDNAEPPLTEPLQQLSDWRHPESDHQVDGVFRPVSRALSSVADASALCAHRTPTGAALTAFVGAGIQLFRFD
ncbi:MAG: hypothetical protein MHM6MM_007853 [Cercozoa sp. M6MM]